MDSIIEKSHSFLDNLPDYLQPFVRWFREKTQEAVEKPDFGITREAGFKVESAGDEINVVFYLKKKNTDKAEFADIEKLTESIREPKEKADNSYYLCYEVIPNNKTQTLRAAGYVVLILDWRSFVFPNGKQITNTPENRYKKIGLSNGNLSGELPEVSSMNFLDFYFQDIPPPEAIPKQVKKDSFFT